MLSKTKKFAKFINLIATTNEKDTRKIKAEFYETTKHKNLIDLFVYVSEEKDKLNSRLFSITAHWHS